MSSISPNIQISLNTWIPPNIQISPDPSHQQIWYYVPLNYLSNLSTSLTLHLYCHHHFLLALLQSSYWSLSFHFCPYPIYPLPIKYKSDMSRTQNLEGIPSLRIKHIDLPLKILEEVAHIFHRHCFCSPLAALILRSISILRTINTCTYLLHIPNFTHTVPFFCFLWCWTAWILCVF